MISRKLRVEYKGRQYKVIESKILRADKKGEKPTYDYEGKTYFITNMRRIERSDFIEVTIERGDY